MFYQSEISFHRCRREHVFCFDIMAAYFQLTQTRSVIEKKIFSLKHFHAKLWTQSSHAYVLSIIGSKKSISLLLLDK